MVAFASTELTKSRRSIEEGAPSTSRNTSPDSGINHSSSDCRTFLSSSSSSSHLDVPTNLLRTSSNSILQIKSSPAEELDSPPFIEVGLPRTPSPSASPTLMYNSNRSNSTNQQQLNANNTCQTQNNDKNLKIPLKYQRHHHQKHYKKKFRERTWEEYDYDESISGGSVTENDSSTLHKSSKFRPKGKDWDWRSDHHRNKNQESDAAPA